MAVNKERVRLLVDALRSGEFEQGQATLRTQADTYCCIGVACEVARRNGIGIEWKLETRSACCDACDQGGLSEVKRWFFDGQTGAFSDTVKDWYGFNEVDPRLGDGDSVLTMIGANDISGMNLSEIADLIDARYLNNEEEK